MCAGHGAAATIPINRLPGVAIEDARCGAAVSFWTWLGLRGRPGELARVQREHGVDPGAAFDLLWKQRELEREGRLIRYVSELPAEQQLLYDQLRAEYAREPRRPHRRWLW